MESKQLIEELERLDKRCFLFEKKRFTVSSVNFYQGRFYLYTTEQRTFVKDSSQFENFLRAIKVEPLNVAPAATDTDEKDSLNKPKSNKTMDSQSNTVVTNAVTNTETVNNELFKMFQQLSGNPTDDDYKKAEAMSKMANTMVSVSQTQINFLRLKRDV